MECDHLPATTPIRLSLPKPEGSDTYCWRREEVENILAFCRARSDLNWLAEVVLALACTGLRISELASLRWSDIDWDKNFIRLTDESSKAPRLRRRKAREIKNRRSRSFPIHADLAAVLKVMKRTADEVVFHGPR